MGMKKGRFPPPAHAIALLWGFAEATLFFIVPDVWTSAVGLERLRRGLVACLWALFGALAGGLVMYLWGRLDSASALAWLDAVPGISPAMLARVETELEAFGLRALFLGPLEGTPYKIYAVEAAASGVPLAAFLLVSIPARLLRFVAVTALAHGLARLFFARFSAAFRYAVLAVAWLLFYAAYFTAMGW